MAMTHRKADVQMLLAAGVHLRTKNCDFRMLRYVWKRRADGIHIINIGKTWEKLQIAARVIVAIENPQDITVQSARPYGQRAVLKFAQHIGAQAIAGRHSPGMFTNQLQPTFIEPRLLILTDPLTDHQPFRESSLGNIPTIAFCDTDSPLRFVDIAVPGNNKGRHSIAALYWLLARMVLQMRRPVNAKMPWNVVVDLFIYIEPEERKYYEDEEEKDVAPFVATEYVTPNYAPAQYVPTPEEFDNRLPPTGTSNDVVWDKAAAAEWEPDTDFPTPSGASAASATVATVSEEYIYSPAAPSTNWNATSSLAFPGWEYITSLFREFSMLRRLS